MPPIPIMSTETLASCAEARQTEAAQTSAANRTGLTIGHDRRLANAVCWFDPDAVRDAASASVVGMVDRLPMMLSFEAASAGRRPIAPRPFAGSYGLSVWTVDQLECGNVGAFQPRL
jgi:hypothetical protein